MSHHTLTLANGQIVRLRCHGASWSALIGGISYVAATRERLCEGIASEFHLPYVPPLFELKHPRVKHHDTLKGSSSTMAARQDAYFSLREMAKQGDFEAEYIIKPLVEYQPSPQARAVTQRIGKSSFLEVTHEELTQHVKDIVLRPRLVLELASALTLKERNDRT